MSISHALGSDANGPRLYKFAIMGESLVVASHDDFACCKINGYHTTAIERADIGIAFLIKHGVPAGNGAAAVVDRICGGNRGAAVLHLILIPGLKTGAALRQMEFESRMILKQKIEHARAAFIEVKCNPVHKALEFRIVKHPANPVPHHIVMVVNPYLCVQSRLLEQWLERPDQRHFDFRMVHAGGHSAHLRRFHFVLRGQGADMDAFSRICL